MFSYTLSIISFNVYLFHVASTFFDYTNNIYTNSASTMTVISYIVLVFNSKQIFPNINHLEKMTVDSE